MLEIMLSRRRGLNRNTRTISRIYVKILVKERPVHGYTTHIVIDIPFRSTISIPTLQITNRNRENSQRYKLKTYTARCFPAENFSLPSVSPAYLLLSWIFRRDNILLQHFERKLTLTRVKTVSCLLNSPWSPNRG